MHSWLLVAHLGQLDLEKPGLHHRSSPAQGWGWGGGVPVSWLLPTAFLRLSTSPSGFYKVFFKQAIFGCFLFLTQCQRSLLH